MKLFSSMLLVTGLAVGSSIAYGQDPTQAAPPQNQSDAGKMTVTGCLTKGASAGLYTITDQKTGETTPIAGPDQLDKYLNQTVKLIGTIGSQGQEKVFKPESVSQVSTTCEKSK
jgi:hypothetical protein